jgi:hypothetical protein
MNRAIVGGDVEITRAQNRNFLLGAGFHSKQTGQDLSHVKVARLHRSWPSVHARVQQFFAAAPLPGPGRAPLPPRHRGIRAPQEAPGTAAERTHPARRTRRSRRNRRYFRRLRKEPGSRARHARRASPVALARARRHPHAYPPRPSVR